MANVCQIVKLINEKLEKIPALNGFQVNDIATIVNTEKNKNVPCIISNDGEARYVGIDDIYNGVLYHRVLSSNWEAGKENNYGDSLNRKLEQHQLVLVVYVKLFKVGIQPQEFASILNANFPTIIDKATITDENIFSALVEFKSADYESESIFKQEYNTDTPLASESYMIKVKYDITMKVNANCINC